MKIHSVIICAVLLSLVSIRGQADVNTGTMSNSASQAVDVAKTGVDASLRDRIVSVYGVGTPTAIQSWWVIFYDPSVASHGRAVKVDNGQVTKTYEAQGGVVYGDALTFGGTQVTGEGAALGAAQDYAAKHNLTYDSVRALLRVTPNSPNLRWRVELMNGATNKGFVFVNAADGAFALYSPPGSVSHTSGTGTGVAGDLEHAGNQVKNTFLGIGGDLQEFFTGDRTVDK